jgi:hypothetical protein
VRCCGATGGATLRRREGSTVRFGRGAAAIFGIRAAATAVLGAASFGAVAVFTVDRTAALVAGSRLTRASATPTPKPSTQSTDPMTSGLRERAIRAMYKNPLDARSGRRRGLKPAISPRA